MFDTFHGNEYFKNIIGSDIRDQSLMHAYVFSGPEGCGKHTAAKLIACALSCSSDNNEKPCLKCHACQKILSGFSPDYVVIRKEEKKTQIGIDAIRNIKSDINYPPIESKYKIYVIEDAQDMTEEAQNAFLLTLESPPEYVLFLLLSSDPDKLLPTIISRAPVITLQIFSRKELSEYLLSTREGSNFSKKDPRIFQTSISFANGSIGKALAVLNPVNYKNVFKFRTGIIDILKAFTGRLDQGAMDSILSLPTARDDLIKTISYTMSGIRDIIAFNYSSDNFTFFIDRKEIEESKLNDSNDHLFKLYEIFSGSLDEIKKNFNIQTVISSLISMAILSERNNH